MITGTLKGYLIVDFDSTFVKFEALEELAGIALKNNPRRDKIFEQILQITRQGMNGEITFTKSLSQRLKLFQANKNHIKKLILLLKNNISDSIKENRQFFIDNSEKIYIISGGFEEAILPVVKDFGISQKHVLANRFIFNHQGEIIGVDKKQTLAYDNGKTMAVKELDLQGKVFVLGDGFTDWQIKDAGLADEFVVFTENVRRKTIVKKAQREINNLNKLPKEFLN